MERAQTIPDFAEIFERVIVPPIFDPWSRDLIERARPIGPSDRILDLGCGTGILARNLRERLGGAARITGLDVSAGMLAVARRVAPELDWREGNAMALPFAAASFELVLSQEMLQFVPDRAAAARELHRVVAPGGRVLLSTWRARAELPLFDLVGRIADAHLGAVDDKRFSFGDGDALHALLVEAGFVDVRVQTVTLIERYPQVPVRLIVMGAGHDLAALSADERERRLAAIEAESAAALARFAVPGGFECPSYANVAFARRAS